MSAQRLFEFATEGALSLELSGFPNGHPAGIAVDNKQDLYIDEAFGGIVKVDPSGNELGQIVGSPAFIEGSLTTGIVVDQSHNDLYVDEAGATVQDISPQCEPRHPGAPTRLCAPIEGFDALDHGAGLAIDAGAGTVYAASTGTNQITAAPATVEAAIDQASEVTSATATVNGEVNPEGAGLTDCRFEYGVTKQYGRSIPCEEPNSAEVGAGSSPVKVHARLTGLDGGTLYHVRLRATNSKPATIASEDETLNTIVVPVIDEVVARNVTAATAELTAKINPKGLVTHSAAHYHFEWGTTTAYGNSIPIPDGALGEGEGDVAVDQQISGLNADTTYHFRVVADDASGRATSPDNTFAAISEAPAEAGCENEALRAESDANPITGHPISTELPDCRAYEMVTPASKNAAVIGDVFTGLETNFSDDGERGIAASIQCFAGATSCTGQRVFQGVPFAFERHPSGWGTTALTPSATEFKSITTIGADANSGTALFSIPTLPSGEDDIYVRRLDGSLADIGPETLGPNGEQVRETHLLGADSTHLLYSTLGRVSSSISPFWPFDLSEEATLYEYVGAGNDRPLLVGVSGGHESDDLISRCSTVAGGETGTPSSYGSLSSDGRVVFFTARSCATGTGTNAGHAVAANTLYARIDGELGDAHTIPISQPTPSECGTGSGLDEVRCRDAAPAAASFQGASLDGSRVFFTDTQQLVDNAGADSRASDSAAGGGCRNTTGPNGCNLYVYDFNAPAGKHIVDASAGDSSGLGPQVQGVMGVAQDGSHIYFVAKGVLTTTTNAAGESPLPGANNLYVFELDAAHPEGHTAFIASLSAQESEPGADARQWEHGVTFANLTPNGRFFVFTSHVALTLDETRSEGPSQVYRYDAQTGQLLRVSIGERGFNNDGNNGGPGANASTKVIVSGEAYPDRSDPTMSDDGAYVFFESPVGLTPRALNLAQIATVGGSAPVYAENIYEWRGFGVDACGEAGGCISLISDGRDTSEFDLGSSVKLLGASTTGRDVFFATADRLVPTDTDTQLDFYDARVEGGFQAPAGQASCQGEECREAASIPSVLGPLGSTTFAGIGNLLPVAQQPGKSTSRPLTKPQKLAKALKACRAKRDMHKRRTCEAQARKRYGPVAHKKRKKKRQKRKSGPARAGSRSTKTS